jgi:hypothetical protein
VSKQFENLSKDLANGVSRRKAFLRFGAGLGAALVGLVTRRPARAQQGIGAFCDSLCKAGDDCGFRNHGQCVSTCVYNDGNIDCFSGNAT